MGVVVIEDEDVLVGAAAAEEEDARAAAKPEKEATCNVVVSGRCKDDACTSWELLLVLMLCDATTGQELPAAVVVLPIRFTVRATWCCLYCCLATVFVVGWLDVKSTRRTP